MSTKKLTLYNVYLRCHNSGKQRRILTKFYINTARLNCKQVAKFLQNRSTSTTARPTASLVRPLKSISVHNRHCRRVCVRMNGKTSAHLKSMFKMPTVCKKSNASSKTWTPLPDHFIDDYSWWCSHSSIRRDFSWWTSRGCGTHDPIQLPPNLVVDLVKGRTVGWPQSWGDEVWCFMS